MSLPPPVRDASAWYGSELAGTSDWIERLSDTEIAEVESAVRQFTHSPTHPLTDSLSLDVSTLTTTVPLPSLAPRLQKLL
jgi:hypothetical protein